LTFSPATLPWFARHELSLHWRDWLSMMTAGKSRRRRTLITISVVVAIGAHWLAASVLSPWIDNGAVPDKATFVFVFGSLLLAFSLMLSQAMESVTRAYYARSDLDLILSSPISPRKLFAVRTSAVAVSITVMPCLFAGPFINVLIARDGLHWLAAYGVIVSLGAFATALGVLITILLFRMAGAKKTRLASQILAAVIGAAFIIGIQAIAVIYYGSLSRASVLQSSRFIEWFPNVDSALWIVARATMGDFMNLMPLMAICLGCFAGIVLLTSASFGDLAIAAAGVSNTSKSHQRHLGKFKGLSARKALRSKEWKLLARDPWLVSQSVMQILYLLPPALLLWSHYGESSNILVVVVPVLVMASGQLAGGLAWLAISGEDAPDLVNTAPLGKWSVLVAKIEAIISLILLIVAPLLVGIALMSVTASLVTAAGVLLAASSATAIQLWFRSQSKRAMFRRRQVASRTATISEAVVSILWAASATLLLVNPLFGVVTSCLTLGLLFFVWVLRPEKSESR